MEQQAGVMTKANTPTSKALELTIVAPTYNEADNVSTLVHALHVALDGKVNWEIVLVDDDSADNTAEVAKKLSQSDPRVRCLHRLGRRGLSTACIEGIMSSSAPYVAVMDADLQHDEMVLPKMLEAAKAGADLVIGSRYVDGGSVGEWDEDRVRISQFSTWLTRVTTKVDISDPMSGFFLMRRSVFNGLADDLSGLGFKILLDICASAKEPLNVVEVPYEFRERFAGESKLDAMAAWEFLMLLGDKTIGRYVPIRFLSFALIGGSGIVVHVGVFSLLFMLLGAGFVVAKTAAVGVSMVTNFLLNNAITYRDRRLKGFGLLKGLATFALVCSVGAVADIGISSYLFINAESGSLLQRFSLIPVMAGILIGVVWNYTVSSLYTWGGGKS
ncbi:MAG: glycosyltransferase family 2 protein [Pseudomonadota bacterium]